MELDTRQNHCENPSGQRGVLSSSAKCCNFELLTTALSFQRLSCRPWEAETCPGEHDEDKSTLRKCHASALLSHWALPTLACMD